MAKVVWVNREDCISCGLCISVAPGVFRFEGGKSIVYDQNGASENKIQECIDNCPVGAIEWQEI